MKKLRPGTICMVRIGGEYALYVMGKRRKWLAECRFAQL